jgi:hypothetical protein
MSDTFARPDRAIVPIVDICAPLSCDIRDTIFIVHTPGNDLDQPLQVLGRRVLDTMRTRQISHVNDLARTAAALVI